MSVPNTSELDDDQIEALIRKLSAIKGSAPELIAALEAEANSRLAASGGRPQRGAARSGSRGRQARGRVQSYEEEEVIDDPYQQDEFYEEEEEEEEEETDSEEDDEFDEDGPCVGYGYSDEVSVISEMTTPTVVSSLHVPEEERYNEIHQGYSAKSKSNKPDLLSQVNRAANAAAKNKANKMSIAAASASINENKRRTYTSGLAAMAKISETAETAAVTKPKTAAPRPPPPSASSNTPPNTTRKIPPRRPSSDGSGSGSAGRKTSSSRGLRRDNSPTRGAGTKKKGTAKKSPPSSGGGGSRRDINKSNSAHEKSHTADAFAGDWHKSLTAVDDSMDDNGFPFSFGDEDGKQNNAFSGIKKKASTGNSGGTDPFDPFSATNGDPFANAKAAFESGNAFGNNESNSSGRSKITNKAKSTGSRPRRTSGINSGARVKR